MTIDTDLKQEGLFALTSWDLVIDVLQAPVEQRETLHHVSQLFFHHYPAPIQKTSSTRLRKS